VPYTLPNIYDIGCLQPMHDSNPFCKVRGLFKMYDTDGSGELDKEEFIEVIMQTGEWTGVILKVQLFE
jgi:hypothetical protein